MQAQDTEHCNSKMHTQLKAAGAKEAQARAELADLRRHLSAQARKNEALQAEIRDLKHALAVRAVKAQLRAAKPYIYAMKLSALFLYSCMRAVRTS